MDIPKARKRVQEWCFESHVKESRQLDIAEESL